MANDGTTDHRISVAKLKELLAKLNDDDVLVPNAEANLAIMRSDNYIGYIDLLNGLEGIVMFDDEVGNE